MIKIYNNEIVNEKIIREMYEILINNLFITYPNYLKEKEKHDNKENFNKWMNMIKNNICYFILTYEIDNKIIGFLNYTIINNNLWISEVQIKDDYKNHKILKELLKYLIKLDICKKYKDITIHINEENKLSKIVFTHIGFNSIGNTLYNIKIDKLIDYLDK